jgi:tRNA(Ile)-lysidine synthase TilS/MesJ
MSAMRRCTRCVLPETFPGIQFDEEGVCQYCRQMPSPERRAEQRARLRKRFEELVETIRTRPGYHCLVSLSGGKDSTYTLWLLGKQYGLRTMAFTFDNGFVSPDTLKNMRLVAENLGSDHLIVKPRVDLLHKVFLAAMKPGMYPPRTLGRASSICNACISIAKGMALRMALEKDIPLLAYGWSPGQIPLASALFHMNRPILQKMVEVAMAPLQASAGADIAAYFPDDELLAGARDYPYNVSPLAFIHYDEEEILCSIDKLAWAPPTDTDPNSTNCLLNGLANLIHLEQMGFHPYVSDLAGLVREGYMEREEALSRLRIAAVPEVMAAVEAKLGLPPRQRRSWM